MIQCAKPFSVHSKRDPQLGAERAIDRSDTNISEAHNKLSKVPIPPTTRVQCRFFPTQSSILYQRLIQILQRIGYAKAEIAFSVVAEGGAGQAGYSGFFQQGVG